MSYVRQKHLVAFVSGSLRPPPSVLNLIVAAVLRDSVWAVSLLPCVADCSCTYCMLVRLSDCLNHIKGKIIIIIIIIIIPALVAHHLYKTAELVAR